MILVNFNVSAGIVSVPYRGATFLNSLAKNVWNSDLICFRPLSGSYISQSPRSEFLAVLGDQKVSVPYRGATFLNDENEIQTERRNEVSVPYRGATFLNYTQQHHRKALFYRFRPLSGSYISQLCCICFVVHDESMFPSPIGELHFSIISFIDKVDSL